MNLGESDWLLIQKECSNLAKKARISGFRLWIIPELSILLLKIAGSGYEIDDFKSRIQGNACSRVRVGVGSGETESICVRFLTQRLSELFT